MSSDKRYISVKLTNCACPVNKTLGLLKTTSRETDRQRDRQTDRETDRQRQRQLAERDRDSETQRDRDGGE